MNSILDDFQEAVGSKYGLIRGNGAELKKELIRDIKAKKVDVVVEVEKGFLKEKTITEKKFVVEVDDLNKALKANNKYLKTLKNERYYRDEIEKVNVIKKELKSKIGEIETLDNAKQLLQNELNNANTTIKELSNKNDELSSQLDKVNENKQEVERAKTILKKYELLSKKNEELSSKLYNYNSLESQVNELKNANNELRNNYLEVKVKDKIIANQKEEINTYKTKFEALQQEFEQYKQVVYKSVVEPIREALSEVSFTSIKNKITELYEYKKSQEQDYDYDLTR
jgi:DNA repair exonuclease SbcCD ATPase subunit